VAAREQAIRAWGASDASARAALESVDKKREAYVRALLIGNGLPGPLAGKRARLLYLALISEFAVVSHGGKPSGKGPFQELVRLVLT
jgi:hypothetical protein